MEGAARFAIRHKGPGQSMSSGTRNRLEAGTGADLHHVRVHTDPVAHIAADHLRRMHLRITRISGWAAENPRRIYD